MTAAEVSGDSGRPPEGACVKRMSTVACCCPTCTEALAWGVRVGGGAIFAGDAAPGCWVHGCVPKPAVKDWCVRDEASTAAAAEPSWTRRTPSRDVHSLVSYLSVLMVASVWWTEVVIVVALRTSISWCWRCSESASSVA